MISLSKFFKPKPMAIGAIFRREEPEPHYEVHYSDRVEFWDLEFNKKLGESKCHPI